VSGAQVSLNCPAKDTSPNTIPPNVATSLIVEVGITFDQPGDWSSFMGSQSSRRTKASAAVTDSWTDARTVAAVVTVSVAVTDSLTEQMAAWLVEVVSAADAVSLIAVGNVVFDDGVSVAVSAALIYRAGVDKNGRRNVRARGCLGNQGGEHRASLHCVGGRGSVEDGHGVGWQA